MGLKHLLLKPLSGYPGGYKKMRRGFQGFDSTRLSSALIIPGTGAAASRPWASASTGILPCPPRT